MEASSADGAVSTVFAIDAIIIMTAKRKGERHWRDDLRRALKPFHPSCDALPDPELIGRVRALVGGRHPENALRGYTLAHAAIRRSDGSVKHLVVLTPPEGASIEAESADADEAFADAVRAAIGRDGNRRDSLN